MDTADTILRYDKRGRRYRFEDYPPTGKTLTITENDHLLWDVLRSAYPLLPSHFIFEFSDLDETWVSKRLRDMRREEPRYLFVPPEFTRIRDLNTLCYSTTSYTDKLLKDRGIVSYFPDNDKPVHKLARSTSLASMEIAFRDTPYTYLRPRHAVTHPKCPPLTAASKRPFKIPIQKTSVEPDGFFSVDYGTEYRHFAFEMDRATENVEEADDHSSFEEKLDKWIRVIEDKIYRDHLGITKLFLLTITTKPARLEKYLKMVEKKTRLPQRFLFKLKPDFGTKWKIPPIMHDLATEPWYTPGGTFSLLSTN